MKNLKAIKRKKEMIAIMILAIKNNEKAILKVGNYDIKNKSDEVKFQEDRLSVLNWCDNKTEKQIQAKIKRLEKTLSVDELKCKYGTVKGLSIETVLIISKIELLEVAINKWGEK